MMKKRCKFNLIRMRYVKTTMICFCTLGFLCGGYIWTHLPEKHKIQSLPMKKWDGGEESLTLKKSSGEIKNIDQFHKRESIS